MRQVVEIELKHIIEMSEADGELWDELSESGKEELLVLLKQTVSQLLNEMLTSQEGYFEELEINAYVE